MQQHMMMMDEDGSEFQNNSTSSNHHPHSIKSTSTRKSSEHVNRKDLVRIIIQALHSLDYKQSAAELEKESGIEYLSKDIVKLRESIMKGSWNECISIVDEILNQSNCKNTHLVKYHIYKQKYLELLENGEIEEALKTLRNELTPMSLPSTTGSLNSSNGSSNSSGASSGMNVGANSNNNVVLDKSTLMTLQQLQLLSSLLLCPDPQSLKKNACWDGKNGTSRSQLLEEIEKYISPSLLIPENRLENLLLKAVKSQKGNDPMLIYDDSDEDGDVMNDVHHDGIPLLNDDSFKRTSIAIPSKLLCTLDDHIDEIWLCKFSHNGEWLATSGIDSSLLLYKVSNIMAATQSSSHDHDNTSMIYSHNLKHNGHVLSLNFSPDDRFILTATTPENEISVWDTVDGKLISSSKKSVPIVACMWNDDGSSYMAVTGERNSHIFIWDVSSVVSTSNGGSNHSLSDSIKLDTRVQDAAYMGNDNIILATYDKQVIIFNLREKKIVERLIESEYISSLLISNNRRFLLVCLNSEEEEPSEIHLWDIAEKRIIVTYKGHKQTRFVLRPTLIGHDYVACGSEDSKIYIWNSKTGQLQDTLLSHINVVNCVAWNKHQQILASCSDDATVKIWTN
ncbi:hypothetical protein C9374_006472 [Naegleria lovaniensis]|uniref:CTLH domain-containing protein n=1 Tax=Naegleria lovaniensis TaxID=51637 RepID=A0AA88KJ69_NAELO|nr:uncharacterized protein C9374_006472 [Naegleria lovaniensis]KAG2381483.1 hypothetical protein C9374_006472 [Naegleria lovaniensis]